MTIHSMKWKIKLKSNLFIYLYKIINVLFRLWLNCWSQWSVVEAMSVLVEWSPDFGFVHVSSLSQNGHGNLSEKDINQILGLILTVFQCYVLKQLTIFWSLEWTLRTQFSWNHPQTWHSAMFHHFLKMSQKKFHKNTLTKKFGLILQEFSYNTKQMTNFWSMEWTLRTQFQWNDCQTLHT